MMEMRPIFFTLLFLTACTQTPPRPQTESTQPTATTTITTSNAAAPTTHAELGKPAPDFTLPDVDGKSVSLARAKGKVVVLEWFNPKCPFVKRNHELGPLKDMAARVEKTGVVWLSINSGAKGKQGNGVEATKFGIDKYGMTNPVLLDEDGKVGHAYGADHTPTMFVIDASGTLVYRGAIDNAPDGDTDLGAPFVNYVAAALADVAAGRAVATPETKAYGCGVKYAD
jgi:peroxiredoxin